MERIFSVFTDVADEEIVRASERFERVHEKYKPENNFKRTLRSIQFGEINIQIEYMLFDLAESASNVCANNLQDLLNVTGDITTETNSLIIAALGSFCGVTLYLRDNEMLALSVFATTLREVSKYTQQVRELLVPFSQGATIHA